MVVVMEAVTVVVVAVVVVEAMVVMVNGFVVKCSSCSVVIVVNMVVAHSSRTRRG